MSDTHNDLDLIYRVYDKGPPAIDDGPVPTQDVVALAHLDIEKAAHLLEDLYNIAHRLAQEVVQHRWNHHATQEKNNVL